MVVALGDRLTHRRLSRSAYDPALCRDGDGRAAPYEYARHGALPLKLRPTVYVTPHTHASVHKNARTLLGAASIREVAMDANLGMSAAALNETLTADASSGSLLPFLVVGTVGATSSGIIDPLSAIGEVARRHGVWLHVDAPWGGIAAFSPRLKAECLSGITHADSITFDPHKTMVPLGAGGAGMFLTRHRRAVERAFNVSGKSVKTYDFPYMSLQGSRVNNGLRVVSQLVDPDALAARIEREAALGDALRRGLQSAGWRLTTRSPLPVVTATHAAIESGRITAAAVVQTLARRGILAKAEALRSDEAPSVRLGIISRRTSEADIAEVISILAAAVRPTHEKGRRAAHA
jgi:glutamate/tyrosine decarboxylase-like PLP-dependent enzyme